MICTLMLRDSNVSELSNIIPELAQYYFFHTSSSSPTSATGSSELLGPQEALQQLLRDGRLLATKSWVDNHYSMILWKLAGMVALDPEKERDPKTRRWCWTEVMRQLEYRCVLYPGGRLLSNYILPDMSVSSTRGSDRPFG